MMITTTYYLIKCRGCDQRSFRVTNDDYENGYQDDYGIWVHDSSSVIYPEVLIGRRRIENQHCLPEIVQKMYSETYSAIAGKNFTLAGMGLRATLEAICNVQKITGKDLSVRISKLKSSGVLGKKDVERLHSIRFLGNDAAHEIKTANPNAVLLALDIIEHALKSLYIFEDEARRVLELPFGDYADLKQVLLQRSPLLAVGPHTLGQWLGDHARRLCDQRDEFEKQVLADVIAGAFTGITDGGTKPAGPKGKQLQLYVK